MSSQAGNSGFNGSLKPVRIAVIDSGVHASHPHVDGVIGGISITRDCREEADYTDRIGHGTAVTAVIREKAPEAAIFAVRIFHDRLTTGIESLVYAIDWSVRNGMHLINLSLGTSNAEHKSLLAGALDRAAAAGVLLVAAHEDQGIRWLPGCLPGALPVALDWDCPRDQYRTTMMQSGALLYHASGYPRPIPGVAPQRNLKGISFAVANVTGLIAKDLQAGRI
jgi:subtilisin family serine protease